MYFFTIVVKNFYSDFYFFILFVDESSGLLNAGKRKSQYYVVNVKNWQ